jgi:hypothetical protein
LIPPLRVVAVIHRMYPVILRVYLVIPVKTGTQDADPGADPAWVPAFAGMTKWGAGMTKWGAGMTKWGAGMTKWGAR